MSARSVVTSRNPGDLDAHVVSVCVPFGSGVVVTSDPDDIRRLAAAVPSIRIVTRPPR